MAKGVTVEDAEHELEEIQQRIKDADTHIGDLDAASAKARAEAEAARSSLEQLQAEAERAGRRIEELAAKRKAEEERELVRQRKSAAAELAKIRRNAVKEFERWDQAARELAAAYAALQALHGEGQTHADVLARSVPFPLCEWMMRDVLCACLTGAGFDSTMAGDEPVDLDKSLAQRLGLVEADKSGRDLVV